MTMVISVTVCFLPQLSADSVPAVGWELAQVLKYQLSNCFVMKIIDYRGAAAIA
jgi:hypothetical protein